VLGLDALPVRRMNHAIANEAFQRGVIQMLELAPAAAAEVTARRCGTVGARLHAAIRQHDIAGRGESDVSAALRHAVTFRGDAKDGFRSRHRKR
jgi:hypothetical protein